MATMKFEVVVENVSDELSPEQVAELLDLALSHGLSEIADRGSPPGISYNDIKVSAA